jgi:hypothetical protein
MNFLITLFKKATKGDSFRTVENPNKYTDSIVQLNTMSPNQSTRLSTNSINKVQKTSKILVQSTTKAGSLPS